MRLTYEISDVSGASMTLDESGITIRGRATQGRPHACVLGLLNRAFRRFGFVLVAFRVPRY